MMSIEVNRQTFGLLLTIFVFGFRLSNTSDSGTACVPYREAPEASTLSCNSTACTATCAPKFKFPKGEITLNVECVNSNWVIKKLNYKNLKTLPGCSPVCSPACANKGKCIAPNRCQCSADFQGPQCREKACRTPPEMTRNAKRTCNPNRCTVTCMPGFKYKNLATTMNLQCKNGKWVSVTKNVQLNSHCEPHCYSKCLNGGTCSGPNVCKCPENFVGTHCQHAKDKCSPKKIGFNGSFECVGNPEELSCSLKCPAGVEFEFPPAPIYKCKFATGVFTPANVPKCVYGEGAVVRTVNQQHGKPEQLRRLEPTCSPQCLNGGSCVFHNTCQCSKDFAGPHCQYSVERCAPQKIGFNGAISCTGTNTGMTCSLTCPPEINFDFQPTSSYSCSYSSGTFTPTRVPKCVYGEGVQVIQRTMERSDFDESEPTCSPSCLNGGSCIFHNLCQCPQGFRGLQCQYSVERCSIKKTGFNGGFRCSGGMNDLSCTISCPAGVEYEFPPAAAYVCSFETGRFTPSRIPNCVFGEGVEVIRKSSSSWD